VSSLSLPPFSRVPDSAVPHYEVGHDLGLCIVGTTAGWRCEVSPLASGTLEQTAANWIDGSGLEGLHFPRLLELRDALTLAYTANPLVAEHGRDSRTIALRPCTDGYNTNDGYSVERYRQDRDPYAALRDHAPRWRVNAANGSLAAFVDTLDAARAVVAELRYRRAVS
jgi:hypothetical protein